MHICPSIEYVEQAWDDAKYGQPSQSPLLELTDSHHVRSVASAARAGTSWGSFCNTRRTRCARRNWDELREPFANRVFELIEEYAPGFRSLIVESRC